MTKQELKDLKPHDTIIYNDGRQGHINIKAEVLENIPDILLIVQIEDRAVETRIAYHDKAWTDYLKKADNADLQTITDIETFFRDLITKHNLNFNPDTDFNDYINTETKAPTFTETESTELNKKMEQAFNICKNTGKDIYKIAVKIFRKERLC